MDLRNKTMVSSLFGNFQCSRNFGFLARPGTSCLARWVLTLSAPLGSSSSTHALLGVTGLLSLLPLLLLLLLLL